MITIVEGRPGMGKSVFLTSKILSYLDEGRKVYTNIRLRLPKEKTKWIEHLNFIESLEDCITLKEGVIVLDEVQTYLNSRNWDKLDIRFQLLLQQHRKRGLDILGATQSVKRADVVFRELIQVFYRIFKIITFRIPFTKRAVGIFILREYDPDSVEGAHIRNYEGVGFLPKFVLADPFTLAVFDTTQEYQPPIRIGQQFIETWVMIQKPEITKQLISRTRVDNPHPTTPAPTPGVVG